MKLQKKFEKFIKKINKKEFEVTEKDIEMLKEVNRYVSKVLEYVPIDDKSELNEFGYM